MDKEIRNTKINRFTFLITGLIFIFFGVFLPIFLVVGVGLLLLAYLTNKKYKELTKKSDPVSEPVVEVESPYIFFDFKVAGVTFKNGRKTRQSILRAFKWGDEVLDYANFEQYEYEGKPAVYVKLNDQIVGNIPSDKVAEYLDLENNYIRDNIHVDVYGGNKLDDGSRTNYGCSITVRYKK